jgi:DNA-binding NarL/FixJ family response regulator
MQGETPTSDGFRILLVDDHGLIRQVIGAMLEGYPAVSIVGEAADGLEAIYLAAVLRPDGIIMDINMPKIDGIEATKRIKAAQPRIRIIGLSVIDDEHVRQAMITAGAEAVLLKDETHQLYEAIRQWTGKCVGPLEPPL